MCKPNYEYISICDNKHLTTNSPNFCEICKKEVSEGVVDMVGIP